MPPTRRFPPPWSVDETDACFIVRDGDKQALAYVYFENGAWPALKCEAADARRGIPDRGEHCQAAKRATANTERHSPATEYGQPGRLSGGPRA
jgi:hypothetical protein